LGPIRTGSKWGTRIKRIRAKRLALLWSNPL